MRLVIFGNVRGYNSIVMMEELYHGNENLKQRHTDKAYENNP